MFFPLPLWLLRQAEGAGSTGVLNGGALKPCATPTHACCPPALQAVPGTGGEQRCRVEVDEGERPSSPAVPSAPARTQEPALRWDTGSSVRPGAGGELRDPSPCDAKAAPTGHK